MKERSEHILKSGFSLTIKDFLILITFCAVVLISIGGCITGTDYIDVVYADQSNVCYPEVASYELAEGDYDFESATPVNEMSYGKKSLGTLKINGIIKEQKTFINKIAYVTNPNISFSYESDSYANDSFLFAEGEQDWRFYDDSSSAVGDIQLSNSISSGVVIVQKSEYGQDYNDYEFILTDFFDENTNREEFYFPDNSDLQLGNFYRIIIAYKIRRWTGEYVKSGFLGLSKEKKYEYRNNVEIFEFYLTLDDAGIKIIDLTEEEDALSFEGYMIKTVNKSTEIEDKGTTTTGFYVEKNTSSSLAYVSKNGEDFVEATENYLDAGKYTIKVITRLGTERTYEVYVLSGNATTYFNLYFGDFLVKGNRIYDESDIIYDKDSKIEVNKLSDWLPSITGYIKNTVGTKYGFQQDSREKNEVLISPGKYNGSFYSGDADISGSFYEFVFSFSKSDKEAKPEYNFMELVAQNTNIQSMKPIHYEVSYNATSGKRIIFCFDISMYEKALNFARSLEDKCCRINNDDYYYKSENISNIFVNYDFENYIKVRDKYAKDNICVKAFFPDENYDFANLSGEQMLDLSKVDVQEDIYAFFDSEQRELLCTELNSLTNNYYLNDFIFKKLADNESQSITAYCHKTKTTYSILYNKNVSEQLSVSSKYIITETNCYGKTRTYDAIYIADNDASVEWGMILGENNVSTKTITSDFSTYSNLNACDSAYIINVSNGVNDDYSFVVISTQAYSFDILCYISDLKNLQLYKKGTYTFTFYNTMGFKYSYSLIINGAYDFDSIIEGRCYTDFYNDLYLTEKDRLEEVFFTYEDLIQLLNLNFEEQLYAPTTYRTYLTQWNSAKKVADSTVMDQTKINQVYLFLQEAINGLYLLPNKEELEQLIDEYHSLVADDYTTPTWNNCIKQFANAIEVFDNEMSTEDQVDASVSKCKSALLGLVKRGSKVELCRAIYRAKQVDCRKFTPESINNLKRSFNSAWTVYKNKDAVQEDIDVEVYGIINSLDALKAYSGYIILREKLLGVQSLDLSLYTKSSTDDLKTACMTAVGLWNNLSSNSAEIDSAIQMIDNKRNALVKAGDKSELLEAIKKINAIKDWYLYEKNDIEELKNAYNKGIAVLKSVTPTETEVNGTYDEIKTKLQNIKKSELKSSLIGILKDIEIMEDLNLFTSDVVKRHNELYQAIVDMKSDDELKTISAKLRINLLQIDRGNQPVEIVQMIDRIQNNLQAVLEE